MDEGQATVWCLLGKKAGDNTQVRALAGELGLPTQDKQIVARPWELLVHLGHRATLAGIDRGASSPLTPPWPDLVISAGRRNEPVAQWIRRQSNGKAKLVHMGRPWAPLEQWDLLVTTPQYFLPVWDNVLHNSLPLHCGSATEGFADTERWQAQFKHLPRPWIAVLMGGDSGRFVMTAEKGQRFGALASAVAEQTGGSVLFSDSPRTPVAAGDAAVAQFSVAHNSYRFGAGGENPYRAYLALADAFAVTGESMSMLGEAADTGRPLYIFDVGDGDRPWWQLAHNYRYKPLSFHFAMRFGPARMRRDVGRIQDALVADGRAAWLDWDAVDAAPRVIRALRDSEYGAQSEAPCKDKRQDKGANTSPAREELRQTAERVRRLLAPH